MTNVIRVSMNRPTPKSFKQHRPKYAYDKMLYQKKIQSTVFSRQDKKLTLQNVQDLIDMTMYFNDEDILYEVLTDMERDMFFDELCYWYRKVRG